MPLDINQRAGIRQERVGDWDPLADASFRVWDLKAGTGGWQRRQYCTEADLELLMLWLPALPPSLSWVRYFWGVKVPQMISAWISPQKKGGRWIKLGEVPQSGEGAHATEGIPLQCRQTVRQPASKRFSWMEFGCFKWIKGGKVSVCAYGSTWTTFTNRKDSSALHAFDEGNKNVSSLHSWKDASLVRLLLSTVDPEGILIKQTRQNKKKSSRKSHGCPPPSCLAYYAAHSPFPPHPLADSLQFWQCGERMAETGRWATAAHFGISWHHFPERGKEISSQKDS